MAQSPVVQWLQWSNGPTTCVTSACCTLRFTLHKRGRAGHGLRAPVTTVHTVPWLVATRKRGHVTCTASLLTQCSRRARSTAPEHIRPPTTAEAPPSSPRPQVLTFSLPRVTPSTNPAVPCPPIKPHVSIL
jgi:hypothetical protein